MLLDRRHHTKHPIAAIVVPTLILAAVLLVLHFALLYLDDPFQSSLLGYEPLALTLTYTAPRIALHALCCLLLPTALILSNYALDVLGLQTRISLLLYLQKYAAMWAALVYANETAHTSFSIVFPSFRLINDTLGISPDTMVYTIYAPLIVAIVVLSIMSRHDFEPDGNDRQHRGMLALTVAVTTAVAVILTCAHPWYLAIIAIPSLLPALVLIPRRPYGIDEPGIYCAEE